MQLTGGEGRLERGYVLAAIVGPYTVTRTKEQAYCQLTATIQRVADAFQLRQPGLRFVVAVQQRRWVWTVASCCTAGEILTARLSAKPEVE